MTSDIAFSVTMEEKDVQRALQNMVKENAKLRAEIGMGVNEAKAAAAQEREWQKLRQQATKEATQQMQALNSAAQKIKDSVATPFEEAKKKTAELRKHLEAGTISTDQYRLAFAKVAKEMKDATRDHAAESAATKEAAEAKREAIATAKAWATAEEVTAEKISKLNQALALGTIDAEKHRRAVAELSRDLKKEAEAAEAAAAAEKKATEAHREAIATARAWATAEEQTAEKIGKLNQALSLGTINAETHARAVAELSRDLKKEAAEAEAAAKSEKEHSQAVKDATAVAEKYATKEERVAAELKRLNALKDKGVLSSKDHARAIAAENAKLQEHGNAADKSGGMIGGLTRKMGQFVAGLAGGSAVIATIRSEYDALVERQGKSKDANLSLAAAQSDALDNLDASMTPEDFGKRMKESSKRLGMSEKDLTIAASSALSAKGDKSAADAITAVEASAKLNRFAPEKLPDMAASTLDLGKHLKMKPEEALGFLIGVGQSSRVVSLKNTAENIAPAIIGGVSQGIPKEKAAAIAASITGTAVDSTGKPTNTTMQALFGQLKEFGSAEFGFTGGKEHQQKMASLDAEHVQQRAALKEQYDRQQIALSQTEMPAAQKAESKRQLDAKEVEARAKLKTSQESQKSQLSAQMPSFTPEQMLDRIMKDPELKTTFFRDKKFGGYGASFEKAMTPAVNQLLTPGTQGHADYQAALAAQQKVNPQQLFDNAVKAKEQLIPNQIAKQDQVLGNFVNQEQLRDVAGAQSAVLRQQLDDMRKAMGDGFIHRGFKSLIEELDTQGYRTVESTIANVEADISDRQRNINYRSNLAPRGDREFKSNPEMAVAQKRDEAAVAAMNEMIILLKEQRDLQQAQVNAAQAQVNVGQAKAHAGALAGRIADRPGP